MPGQLRYNNAPQPYLFDVSAAFRNAADLINTPLRHFGEVADKITTSIQNQNTNELYRYLASQYDPNNVQSINQALARAAGDKRFSNVGADTWRQATGDYRRTQSELLEDENLALAKRAMDPYQVAADIAHANANIARTRGANTSALDFMRENKIRSDAYKAPEVDALLNSASGRALQGARAAAIRAAAARAKQEADNALALSKMKEFYLSNANAGADQRNLNVGQEAIRRFGNSYVNAEFMDWVNRGASNQFHATGEWGSALTLDTDQTPSMVAQQNPEDQQVFKQMLDSINKENFDEVAPVTATGSFSGSNTQSVPTVSNNPSGSGSTSNFTLGMASGISGGYVPDAQTVTGGVQANTSGDKQREAIDALDLSLYQAGRGQNQKDVNKSQAIMEDISGKASEALSTVINNQERPASSYKDLGNSISAHLKSQKNRLRFLDNTNADEVLIFNSITNPTLMPDSSNTIFKKRVTSPDGKTTETVTDFTAETAAENLVERAGVPKKDDDYQERVSEVTNLIDTARQAGIPLLAATEIVRGNLSKNKGFSFNYENQIRKQFDQVANWNAPGSVEYSSMQNVAESAQIARTYDQYTEALRQIDQQIQEINRKAEQRNGRLTQFDLQDLAILKQQRMKVQGMLAQLSFNYEYNNRIKRR